MKKSALLIIAVTLLAACTPQEQTAEQVSQEIAKTRTQITDLNVKLSELEATLSSLQPEDASAGIPVTLSFIETSSFESYIRTSAIIEAVNEAMISPEVSGKILKIHVDEGQKVKKGQLLVTLDGELMQRGLEELEKGMELTKMLYDKQKELYDQGVGSELQFLEVQNRYESMLKSKETLKSQLDMTRIYAPFDGYIEKRFMKVGEVAAPGRQIIHIVDLSGLHIRTDLSETYLGSVREKDTVKVSFPHFPDMEKTATISWIGKTINTASRTFSLRVDMNNKDEKLKPNMLADLVLRDYFNPKAVVVPVSLVRQDPNGSFVWLARQHDGDSYAVKTYVETGRSDGENTEIISGLKPGDALIIKGYNQVRDGNKIQQVQ